MTFKVSGKCPGSAEEHRDFSARLTGTTQPQHRHSHWENTAPPPLLLSSALPGKALGDWIRWTGCGDNSTTSLLQSRFGFGFGFWCCWCVKLRLWPVRCITLLYTRQRGGGTRWRSEDMLLEREGLRVEEEQRGDVILLIEGWSCDDAIQRLRAVLP